MFFLFGGSGSRGSGLTCRKQHQIPWIFPGQFRGFFTAIPWIFHCKSGDFSPRFWGFYAAILGNFSCDFREFPGISQVGNDKMCLPFSCSGCDDDGATATLVLHDAWTRCSILCDGRKPAESGGNFGGHDTKIRREPAIWKRG